MPSGASLRSRVLTSPWPERPALNAPTPSGKSASQVNGQRCEAIDELYRERVEKARRMSPAEKIEAGLDLFELTSSIMADGIRYQFPGIDDCRVQQILRERLALIRRREENA